VGYHLLEKLEKGIVPPFACSRRSAKNQGVGLVFYQVKQKTGQHLKISVSMLDGFGH